MCLHGSVSESQQGQQVDVRGIEGSATLVIGYRLEMSPRNDDNDDDEVCPHERHYNTWDKNQERFPVGPNGSVRFPSRTIGSRAILSLIQAGGPQSIMLYYVV